MNEPTQSDAQKVQWVEITEDNTGQRLDNFLLAYLKGVPKSRIYRIVRKGEVRVNKGRKAVQYRLHTGDLVRIPPLRVAQKEIQQAPSVFLNTWLQQNILFEDEYLLVINKPAGFAVHGGSGIKSGIIESLRQMRADAHFLELVHRLDRDTSGCLIIAKKRSSLRILHELFRGDGIRKTYLALLSGRWQRKKLQVDVPLQKNVRQGGERMVIVDPAGKPAQTFFLRRQRLARVTWVEAVPKTGRTHQIRVHAAWLGHPIIGDPRYGDVQSNRLFREKNFKRMFLHAAKLEFKHPVSGRGLSVSAPLPDEFERLLSNEK